MVPLGHITNIPREASISCITMEIKLKMMENKRKREEESDDTNQHGYDVTSAPNFYLDRTRVYSDVCTDTNGNTIQHKVVDNYAHIVYAKKEDVEKNRHFFETYSNNLPMQQNLFPLVYEGSGQTSLDKSCITAYKKK